MLPIRRDIGHVIDSQITANNYTFNKVKEFIYLGSAIITKNDVILEIKCRIILANRYCYGLNRQLSSRYLSQTTELIPKTLILPLLLYGAEIWVSLSTDAVVLTVFEREKFYVNSSVQCDLEMISVFEQ